VIGLGCKSRIEVSGWVEIGICDRVAAITPPRHLSAILLQLMCS